MDYQLSAGAFFVGILILAVGAVFMRYHQWVADNFGSGAASYDRYKLYALLTCLLGLIVMINLHTMLLTWLANLLFHRG